MNNQIKEKTNSWYNSQKSKGFTLVELIVVLVILAILAAILVPTLLGYIDRARSEKDFSTAQTVRVAAQAEIDQAYGDNTITGKTANTTGVTSITAMAGTIATGTPTYGAEVTKLAGVGSEVSAFSFTYSGGIINEGYVVINNHVYHLTSGSWKVETSMTAIPDTFGS